MVSRECTYLPSFHDLGDTDNISPMLHILYQVLVRTLYTTVLIYKAIFMKQSSYWVTCVPFKQCTGQRSSYGIGI